jgi:hypothetical protein
MSDQHSLATYVSDMLAVERHIRIPFETQRADGDVREYEDAAEVVNRLVALCDMHVEGLKKELERLGGHEASPIKSAVTELEGFVAGAIDKMRKTKVSKALRDDYTALGLCCVSYSELLATANGLHDGDVAALAKRHLTDYANAIMQIGECVPGVVLRELNDTPGVDVDATLVDRSRQEISEAWQSTARSFHERSAEPNTTTGTIEAGSGNVPTV